MLISKMTSNRNPVSSWFITFPQCGSVTKHTFRIPDYRWAAIVQETHQDGQPHIHAVFSLSTKMTFAQMKSYYETNYPNDWKRIKFEPTRSVGASATYFTKEDKEPLLLGSGIPQNLIRILKVEPQVPTKWYNRFDDSKPNSVFNRSKRFIEERVCSLQLSPEEAHYSLMNDYWSDDAHDYRDLYWMDTRYSRHLFGADYQLRNYYDRVVKCNLKT